MLKYSRLINIVNKHIIDSNQSGALLFSLGDHHLSLTHLYPSSLSLVHVSLVLYLTTLLVHLTSFLAVIACCVFHPLFQLSQGYKVIDLFLLFFICCSQWRVIKPNERYKETFTIKLPFPWKIPLEIFAFICTWPVPSVATSS